MNDASASVALGVFIRLPPKVCRRRGMGVIIVDPGPEFKKMRPQRGFALKGLGAFLVPCVTFRAGSGGIARQEAICAVPVGIVSILKLLDHSLRRGRRAPTLIAGLVASVPSKGVTSKPPALSSLTSFSPRAKARAFFCSRFMCPCVALRARVCSAVRSGTLQNRT